MGVRGVKQGRTNEQIEVQVKNAAAALLAVMRLQQRPEAALSEESVSYLNAVERRALWIRQRFSLTAAATAAPVEQADDIQRFETAEQFIDAYNTAASSTSVSAAAEEIETHLGVLPFSLIDEIHERRQTTYRGIDYRVSPDVAAKLKTDLDYLMAFVVALREAQ